MKRQFCSKASATVILAAVAMSLLACSDKDAAPAAPVTTSAKSGPAIPSAAKKEGTSLTPTAAPAATKVRAPTKVKAVPAPKKKAQTTPRTQPKKKEMEVKDVFKMGGELKKGPGAKDFLKK